MVVWDLYISDSCIFNWRLGANGLLMFLRICVEFAHDFKWSSGMELVKMHVFYVDKYLF